MKFVDPKKDMAFKKVFGSERAIKKVSLLDPYQAPKLSLFKGSVLDVQAEDEKGEKFIVEMHVQRSRSILGRGRCIMGVRRLWDR